MLPNLNRTVLRFAQQVELKSITQTVVNHRPVNAEISLIILATIVPASAEILKSLTIDESLSYYSVFTVKEIKPNDRIMYKAKSFKVIQEKDYNDYGYNEYIIEEIK